MTPRSSFLWKIKGRRSNLEATASIVAVWEASLDPISDDYTPGEIPARDLFAKWTKVVRKKHPNALVPLHWFVEVEGEDVGTFEFMPFQYEHLERSNHETFLTSFTWPTNAKTGEPLNWLSLPVKDKLWRRSQANKGGFIQEATGWKPSVMQPFMYLPSLERAMNPTA